MATIQFIDHKGKNIEGHVGKDNTAITIGRGKDADLRVQNPTVSRVHCQVLFGSGNFYVEDLESSNGTYYNMEKLNPKEPVPLEDGDVFFAGNLEVKFHFEDEDYLAVDVEDSLPLPMPEDEEGVAEPEEETVIAEVDDSEALVQGDFEVVSDDEKPDEEEEPEPEKPIEEPVFDAIEEEKQEEPKDDSPVGFGEVRHTVMEKLETVAEDTQRQIAELEDQIMDKDEIISGLQRQVDELHETVTRLQQTENEPDNNNGVSLDEMQSLLDGTEAENARMEDLIDQLNARIAGDEEKLKGVAELEKEIERLKAVEQENDQLNARVSEVQGQLEETGKKLAKAEEDAKNAVQTKEFERIVKEKDALEEENRRWEELKKQFEQDLADLKTQRDALKDQLERAKADAGQTDELAAKLHEAESLAEELTKDLENARLANRSYIKKVSRLLEANEKLKSASDSVDESALDELKGLNKELQAQVSDLQTRLERAEGTVATPQEYIKLREAYEDLNELIHQLQTDVDILAQLSSDQSIEAEEKTSKLDSQAGRIRESVDEFKTGLKSMDKVLKKLGI